MEMFSIPGTVLNLEDTTDNKKVVDCLYKTYTIVEEFKSTKMIQW